MPAPSRILNSRVCCLEKYVLWHLSTSHCNYSVSCISVISLPVLWGKVRVTHFIVLFLRALISSQIVPDAPEKLVERTRLKFNGECLHGPVTVLYVSIPKYSNPLENEVIQLDRKSSEVAALTTKRFNSLRASVFSHWQGISQGQDCSHPPDFMSPLQCG